MLISYRFPKIIQDNFDPTIDDYAVELWYTIVKVHVKSGTLRKAHSMIWKPKRVGFLLRYINQFLKVK